MCSDRRIPTVTVGRWLIGIPFNHIRGIWAQSRSTSILRHCRSYRCRFYDRTVFALIRQRRMESATACTCWTTYRVCQPRSKKRLGERTEASKKTTRYQIDIHRSPCFVPGCADVVRHFGVSRGRPLDLRRRQNSTVDTCYGRIIESKRCLAL